MGIKIVKAPISKKDIAGLIKRMLFKYKPGEKAEALKDCFIEKKNLFGLIGELKKQGKVKFLGITGHHDSEILIEAIKRYDFDTILLCVNAGDSHYLPFITTVIPEARKKGMGVIAMKVTSQGHALSSIKMEEAFDFSLSQDVDLAIIGCKTPQEVEQNASLARNFKPLSRRELADIENKTKDIVAETN